MSNSPPNAALMSGSASIRVGILHSLTGTMALSEAPLVDAALMAIAEINQAGGLLGCPLEPILRDGASRPEQFEQRAQQLIEGDRVAVIFGCWASFSRKVVIPIVERHNVLLWYPLQYEGLEVSDCVFYTGSCLNQQIEPALDWLLAQGRRKLYLVGSDYVFPQVAHKIIRAQLQQGQGQVVGESRLPLGAKDFDAIARQLLATQPDAIFNTLNGDSNIAFYRLCQAAGITPEQMPIMAVSVAESELQRIGPAATGHYACWSYFQSLDLPSNQAFVQRFKQRYGPDRVTSDPIEAAYSQVYLWQQAAIAAQSVATDAVRQAVYGLTWEAPGGPVHCEVNHHLQKQCRIGRIQADGQFETVYTSGGLLPPYPWLGVEAQRFETKPVVIEMLREAAQGVQYSWELERQSAVLRQTMTQLRHEIDQREQAQEQLKAANAEVNALNQILRADNVRMRTELNVARQIQQRILPQASELQAIADLDIVGFMAPADEVGGDYYDVLETEGVVTIAIGDVTGHGLESGLLMLMTQVAVRTLQEMSESDPVTFLATLNRAIYRNIQRMKSDRNLTLAILTYAEGHLSIGGQHEEVLVVRAGGAIERVDTIDLGLPIGLDGDITPFIDQATIELQPGDGLVLYTDGITEANNLGGKRYGLDRLCQVISHHWSGAAAQVQQAIVADLYQFIGDQKIFDDITLLVLKR
ncbi:MAG: transporter substrate-binding protein [Spirulinaceae cyanobacterium]